MGGVAKKKKKNKLGREKNFFQVKIKTTWKGPNKKFFSFLFKSIIEFLDFFYCRFAR